LGRTGWKREFYVLTILVQFVFVGHPMGIAQTVIIPIHKDLLLVLRHAVSVSFDKTEEEVTTEALPLPVLSVCDNGVDGDRKLPH